jgi:hypothetical protein
MPDVRLAGAGRTSGGLWGVVGYGGGSRAVGLAGYGVRISGVRYGW